MQAFYFRNNPGETACQEAPSVLAIKSPENITVDLTANGANIRLGSLIMLKILPGGEEMELTTLEGMAILNADTPDAINVPAGFTTTRCLNNSDNLGSDDQSNDQEVGDDCAWEEPTIATEDQLLQGEIVRGAIIQLNLENGVILPLETPTPPLGDECPAGTNITHIVSAGENLFRIGLRYSTGMGAIMQANNLSNPQVIYAGQQLVIPCGVDTGLPTVPQPPVVTTTTPSSITPVDCSRFRASSPLDGLSYPSTTFYWDGATGATGYRVNLFNLDEKNGALVGSFLSQDNSTNLTADVSIEAVGYGFSFAWEVEALYNGQVACTSPRHDVPRQAPAAPIAPVAGGFTASWSCIGGVVTVSYANVPAGDTTINISFINITFPMGTTLPVPPTSGSAVFSPVTLVSAGSVTAFPSGTSITLTPASMAC
jgi:LysM repeat protein